MSLASLSWNGGGTPFTAFLGLVQVSSQVVIDYDEYVRPEVLE